MCKCIMIVHVKDDDRTFESFYLLNESLSFKHNFLKALLNVKLKLYFFDLYTYIFRISMKTSKKILF